MSLKAGWQRLLFRLSKLRPTTLLPITLIPGGRRAQVTALDQRS